VEEKRRQILRFLREEIWSVPKNFGELLQIKPAATYRTLASLVEADMLRTLRIPVVGGHLSLWGITAHGQAMGAEPGEYIFEKVFSPSRISPRYVNHTLDIQWLRIKAERMGWSKWVNADRIEKWAEGQPRPDAFAVDTDGRTIAVECERTIKTPKRYVQILNSWLQSIRRGDVERVIWVSPDPQVRDRLKQIVLNITHVDVAGQSIMIPRDRFENLSFLTYAEWPLS
jgi:DNA-binding transcriptional ArsR family regulator